MPAKGATAADAELILKLYDLRRETVMRQARNYIANDFWPQSYEDFLKIISSFGSQENAYLRQVLGYWEMAASLVLRGALNQDLFFDNSGEMFFVFAKCKPHLKRLREEMKAPEALANVEKVIMATPKGRQRIAEMEERLASFAARTRKAAAQ